MIVQETLLKILLYIYIKGTEVLTLSTYSAATFVEKDNFVPKIKTTQITTGNADSAFLECSLIFFVHIRIFFG